MIPKELQERIAKLVQSQYNRAALPTALQALDQFLALGDPQKSNDELDAITEMLEANDARRAQMLRHRYYDLENFILRLLELVDPEKLKTPPPPFYENETRPKWQLAHLIRDGIKAVPPDSNMTRDCTHPQNFRSSGSEYPYRYHYLIIYWLRNHDIHAYNNIDLADTEVHACVAASMVTKLYACQVYAARLAKLSHLRELSDVFDSGAFTAGIAARYRALVKSGFQYMDVHWTKEKQSGSGYTVQELAAPAPGTLTHVKLLGEAGTGKSTALRRIEYTLAVNSQKEQAANAGKDAFFEPQVCVPIYVELSTVGSGENALQEKIAERMGLDATQQKMLVDFFRAGRLCLLLDGLNELLDNRLFRSIAKEVEALARNYPNLRIFVTDRAAARASAVTLGGEADLYLLPISLADKRAYLKKLCANDPATFKLLSDRMDEPAGPAYYSMVDTPLKLNQLVDATREQGAVPEDIVHTFLEYLLDREWKEKKDPNVKYLHTVLPALALLNEPNWNDYTAKAHIGKYINQLALNSADSAVCLDLALEMGILVQEEDGVWHFSSEEYRRYFRTYARMSGLPRL